LYKQLTSHFDGWLKVDNDGYCSLKFMYRLLTINNELRTHFLFTFALRFMEGVAQLVRASVCGTEGRGFETHHPPS
jgi:hypothetical protein